MKAIRDAVVKNADGKFLGNRGRWVSEYPDALWLTIGEAKKMLAGAGPGSMVVAHYGYDNEEVVASWEAGS